MNRPLEELTLRIRALSHAPENLREECIGIAREKSPSAAFDLASIAARTYGVDAITAMSAAKATRWLAVIRRDYGDTEFNQAAGTLATTTPTIRS